MMQQLGFGEWSVWQHPMWAEVSPVILNEFRVFHENNPNVYDLFKRFTRDVRSRGFRHYSAKAIFERIRWHVEIETCGEPFKVNNNYTAFYARMFIIEHPDMEDFFRTRGHVVP